MHMLLLTALLKGPAVAPPPLPRSEALEELAEVARRACASQARPVAVNP